MALTVTKKHEFVIGDRRWRSFDVTFDSSYATGGETLALATLQLAQTGANDVPAIWAEPTTAGAQAVYDRTNKKLMLFTSGSTEASSTSDQSAVVVRLHVIAR